MNGLLLGISIALIVFYALFGICLFRNAKKQSDDDKNKMDGQPLDRYDIPEEDMGFFCGEQPFIDRLERYN
jgi:hypothetical protein